MGDVAELYEILLTLIQKDDEFGIKFRERITCNCKEDFEIISTDTYTKHTISSFQIVLLDNFTFIYDPSNEAFDIIKQYKGTLAEMFKEN